MRCDAEWLGKILAQLPNDELSPIVNLGAATRHFREVQQPHIHRLVFAPLEARGVRVIHSDIKVADGVDVAGDIYDDATLARIKSFNPRAVICTHMFEHVVDRQELSRRLLALLPPGGLFFVTVPYSYPEHHDPIDTMYRPSPDELASLFASQEIIERAVLVGDTYRTDVRKRPITIFFRHFARFFIPFLGWRAWKRSMRKLWWLAHNYQVSAIVGRKPA